MPSPSLRVFVRGTEGIQETTLEAAHELFEQGKLDPRTPMCDDMRTWVHAETFLRQHPLGGSRASASLSRTAEVPVLSPATVPEVRSGRREARVARPASPAPETVTFREAPTRTNAATNALRATSTLPQVVGYCCRVIYLAYALWWTVNLVLWLAGQAEAVSEMQTSDAAGPLHDVEMTFWAAGVQMQLGLYAVSLLLCALTAAATELLLLNAKRAQLGQ